MTLRLTLFSQEVEDFAMEIKIDSGATFADLHRLILRACGYRELGGQKFLFCDEDWRVTGQVCMCDTGARSDEDVYLMERTAVGDLVDDEGQRLAYVFDPVGGRFFLMELTENIFRHPEPAPRVSRRHGSPPLQRLPEESPEAGASSAADAGTGENFYGDDGFDDEEIDPDGFGISG